MKKTGKSLIFSVISIVICVAMLAGSTYAWFTDSVTSGNNIIKTGSLDLTVLWADDLNGTWNDAEDKTAGPIFNYEKWEPGYTVVRYVKIVNDGTLAFKYTMNLVLNGEDGDLANVIDVYFVKDATENVNTRDDVAQMTKVGTLADLINGTVTVDGVLLPDGETATGVDTGETVVAIALKMQEEAGNEYQNKSVGAGFSLQMFATQYDYESDDLGDDYDEDSKFDGIYTTSANITLGADNKTDSAVEVGNNDSIVNAYVPAGVKFEDGATSADLTVTVLGATTSNLVAQAGQKINSADVHVNVAPDNETPVIVNIKGFLDPGLNQSDYELFHVENGNTVTMNLVSGADQLVNHNDYTYDPATGDVSMALKSFSEIAILANLESVWDGGVDHSWYDPDATELTIANADQLNSFAQIVGGMAEGIERDDFAGKTVKLVADINIGDLVDENGKVFYPVGYYNSTESFEKASGGEVTSNVYSFAGTFDGNGKKIKNFYQNTWEMFGDYNDGYSGTPNHYKDAMGLFGYVNGGTIKNLTVENFSSDGEFTPTGVIAAYACNATFENIAIIDCNPRVYNTGNGGIVGIGGNSDDPEEYKLTFRNITVDNSNKITALWGSWDVACGGLVGMFRGAGHVYMDNCHVAAQIDAYNDVCGNYQYYWYRYSGMLIGTNKNMYTDDQGYTVPETHKYHATDCTVNFDVWNDYYYCELVVNSIASYTHDHQFSRLTQVASVDVENMKVTYLDETVKDIPTTGRQNYVVVDGKHGTDNATCYHFVDGAVWNHEDAGTELLNGETVLKEDNQHIYLPFNQLFTGYGWGVKHVPIYNDGRENPFEGVTVLDVVNAGSVDKFEASAKLDDTYDVDTVITVGDIFAAVAGVDPHFAINDSNVQVTISSVVGTVGDASIDYVANEDDWTKGKLTIGSGTGMLNITITDYYFCKSFTVTVEIVDSWGGGIFFPD